MTGYTCGVYDLFHIGHINLFKRIKQNFQKKFFMSDLSELKIGYEKYIHNNHTAV